MEENEIIKDKNNIAVKIKTLLFNYDLTIAYIQAEIDLRENQINLIDSVVATSDTKKASKKDKRKKIYLKSEIEIFESSLKDLLKRRYKLTNNISLIFDRFKNPGLMKAIFIDYFLNENKTKEELIHDLNITEAEFNSMIELLNKQLLQIYRI